MGYVFFKGLRLLFSPNVPGATFIQGAMLIPESRVVAARIRASDKDLPALSQVLK